MEWRELSEHPKEGSFIIGVYEWRVDRRKKEFHIYEAKVIDNTIVWGKVYSPTEFYRVMGWMPIPPAPAW